MFLETIHTEGLGHLSYILGDAGKAFVIDPRRDCHLYVEIAARHAAKITHILETHCHEDFVSGAVNLSALTHAKILHGPSSTIKYGEIVHNGARLETGNISLQILETPGHTPESISLVMYDHHTRDMPVAVFTGDTLLAGDIGRTDLYGDLQEELTEKLFDSLHRKLIPLGDHIIIYPAHWGGAICCKTLATRKISTIGYERQSNPILSRKRKDFLNFKATEEHYLSPYFRYMKKFNQEGLPLLSGQMNSVPENADGFADIVDRNGMIVVDTRSPESYAAAHIPGSLAMPLEQLPLLAGWFLPYNKEIALIHDRDEDAAKARLYLIRIGYDNATRYLAGGMNAWVAADKPFVCTPVIPASALNPSSGSVEDIYLLDVRPRAESEKNPVNAQRRIWLGELPQHLGNLPRDRKIITFCGTGEQAMVAASLLQHARFTDVGACLGSNKCIQARRKRTWKAADFPDSA